jgi:ribosomal protein S18 acetylase RimI-like enzyme
MDNDRMEAKEGNIRVVVFVGRRRHNMVRKTVNGTAQDVSARRAVAADATTIAACVDAAYSPYVGRIGKRPAPVLTDYVRAIAEYQVWIVEGKNSDCKGVLVLIPKPTYLLLDNVAVHPKHQGRGIGCRLIALAEAEAIRQGFRELRLYTNEKMVENIAMYKHLGWEEVGRGVEDGYKRVFMRKTPKR